MSDQPKPQEWRYEEFHPSHYKVFIGNREIGFVSSEDEAQWITLEGNAALSAEWENLEQFYIAARIEDKRAIQQLREQLAAEQENVTLATQMVHIESRRANEAEQKVQPLVEALIEIAHDETIGSYKACDIARNALEKVGK